MTTIIRDILTDLERTRENMLALSDDIWLSIDHNNIIFSLKPTKSRNPKLPSICVKTGMRTERALKQV